MHLIFGGLPSLPIASGRLRSPLSGPLNPLNRSQTLNLEFSEVQTIALYSKFDVDLEGFLDYKSFMNAIANTDLLDPQASRAKHNTSHGLNEAHYAKMLASPEQHQVGRSGGREIWK